jgi:hypothetical protein
MLRQVIDIEDVLIWAYRHVEIDRRARDFLDPAPPDAVRRATVNWSAIAAYGCLIDQSNWAVRPTSDLLDDPSEDAIRVHDAVLALPAVFIEWIGPDEISFPPLTPERIAALGATIEAVPGGWLLRNAVGDAVPVERVEPAVLAIIHARAGSRPTAWGGWETEEHPEDGLPEVTVLRDRMEYVIWRQALVDLVTALDGRLDGHEVTGPRAESEPWKPKRIVPARPATIFRRPKPEAARRISAVDGGKK